MMAEGGDELRIETKFVAAETERANVLAWIAAHPARFQIPFPERRVNNVYFESWDYRSFGANVYGDNDRAKLRYRWYGESEGPAAGALELKRRRSGIGWKLREPVAEAPWRPGDDWRGVRAKLLEQLSPLGREWLHASPMVALLNRYRRSYFVSADGLLRLTVDWELGYWDQRFGSEPNFGSRAHAPSLLVVEVKCAAADRKRFGRALTGMPIRVGRNSKYVNGLRIASGS